MTHEAPKGGNGKETHTR